MVGYQTIVPRRRLALVSRHGVRTPVSGVILLAPMRPSYQPALPVQFGPKSIHLIDQGNAVLLKPLEVLDERRLTSMALR